METKGTTWKVRFYADFDVEADTQGMAEQKAYDEFYEWLTNYQGLTPADIDRFNMKVEKVKGKQK